MKNQFTKTLRGVQNSLLTKTMLLLFALAVPLSAYASSPVVTGLDPLNNETNVNLDQTFSLNFDQNIYTGLTGKKIRLIDVNTENILYSATINSSQISIVGAVISWTLPAGVVDYSKNYYINMEPGAVRNGGGEYFSGMSYASWKITTKADNEAPVLKPASSRPIDGVAGYYLKSSFVELVFNEDVQAGTGNITIKRTDNDAVVMNVDVTNSADISQASGNNRFTVIPTGVLDYGTSYYLEVDNGAITDLLGNAFAGIGPNEITFSMQVFVDTEAPVVSSFLPADNATDVAIDTDLSIVFDEDVQKGTGSIFIKSLPGGAIVHTINLASVTITDNIASFPLPSDLSLSTGYFVTMVSGVFEDTSGNAFAGFTNSTTWSFTTGSGLDTTPPTVSSLLPINGATEVGAGNIDVLFDYFIQKGTGSIYLKDAVTDAVINSVNIASEDVLVLDGSYHLRMTFFIDYTLTNREFYIEMGSGVIQDLAGNDFAGFSKGDWQFKTPDTILPVVTNSSPASRSTGVALDATITFTVSEPLRQPQGGFSIAKLLVDESIYPLASINPQGKPREPTHYVPSEDITITGNTISFDLPGSGTMEEGFIYHILNSSGILDLAGNETTSLTSSPYVFKTISSDVTGPVVTSTDPADNAIDVPYLPSLSITFDEPIKKTNGNFLFYRASDDGIDRQMNILSPEVVINGSTMTITPNTTFQPNTEYYIQMGGVIADFQDNVTSGISGTGFSFTTIDPGDVTAPTVASLFPIDNATSVAVGSEFTLIFDEEIKLSETGGIAFRRVSDNFTLKVIDLTSSEVAVVGKSLTIKPSADIYPNTEMYVQITNVIQDASDNYFPGFGFADHSWSFTTAPDVTPPTLLSTYPAFGESDIPVDANFTMLFDERIMAVSSLLLYSASDDQLLARFSGSENVVGGANNTEVTLNPTADLEPGKEYYIRVTNSAYRDISLNYYEGLPEKQWLFTTAGAPAEVIAPSIVSFSPAHLSTTFSATPKLSITFDESIAAGTGNLRLKDKSNDNIIAVVSINSAIISDATITFDPGVTLPKDGNTYYVIIDNGAITDLAGNTYAGIANNSTWNFSTDDNALPFIITKSPADGNGEVANLGASFDLTFNENISEGTGSLSIYNYDTNQLVEEFEMGVSAFYSISNATITLNSQITFDPNTHYYIRVDNGAIEDTNGNLFGGMFDKDVWDFTTFGEDIAPLLSSTPFSPIDGATSVGISDNLVITFNEDIQASLGGFAFLKYAAGTTREVIDLNSASVTISGNTLTINLANDLIYGLDFYINIQAGAITDLAGNEFTGIFDATTWNFTAELAPDLTAPFVTTITPYDGRTHIAIDSDLTMFFSENVQKGSGNILIKNFSTDATVQTIDVATAAVTIAGQLVTVNPASDLGNLTEYYVEIPSGVFQDMAGNNFAGYAKPDWSFTTIIFTDVTPPSIASLSPVDGATNLNSLDNFTITFDEPIKKGSGFLQIYDDGDVLIQNINSLSSANVTFEEYSITINPTSALAYGKTYYIVIGSGIVKDLSNNAYSLAKGEWDFSTSATDTHAPNLITLNPVNGAVDKDRLNNNLFMTFDENMTSGVGNVYVRRVDNDAIEITKAGTSLNNLGTTVIWLSAGGFVLDYGTEYYVEVEPTAITDLAGNPFAGIAKGEYHFTTIEDVSPPIALSQGPTHNTTGYGIINNVRVVFNEPVQFGVGAIILRDAVSGDVLETYNESSPEVNIIGSTLDVDPASPYLQYETQYSVEIGGNLIQDLAGNPFAGIAEGDWLFTTVDKRTQTISFTTLSSRAYGSGDFTLNASATSGLQRTYEVVEGPISIDGSTVSILGAGEVTIRVSQAGNDEYQAAVSVEQSFEVTKKLQSISFGSQPSKVFGATPFALTATVASGLEVEFSVVSGPAIHAGNDVIITGVGTVIIAANQHGNENYAAADEVQRSITVTKANQFITFSSPSNKTFGDADFDLDATSDSGLEISYSIIGGPATISGNTVSITGIGEVGIRASQPGNVNYNTAGSVDQFFEVTKADQTITFSTPTSKTYGDSDFDLTATSDSELAVTYSLLSGPASLSGNTLSISGTGTVNIRATQAGNSNYNIASPVDHSFTVNQKAITVTADVKSKVYGEVDPALTYQITSGALEIGDSFTGSLTRATGENVNAYAINVGSVSAGANYNISYISADLTISTKGISITADAKSKVYGEVDPALTYQITSGALESGDELRGSLSRNSGESVGTHGIGIGVVSAPGNYTLTFVGANLTISAKAITITADAKSKVFREADPALTYQITSGALESEDSFTGSLVRVTGEDVNTYAINVGTVSAGDNYAVSYTGADLTISTKAITITANAKSKVYGEGDPDLTYQVTSGALEVGDIFIGSLARAAGEDVNTYAINVGTVSAGSNYNTSYVSADLTILKANQTITITRIIDKAITDTSFGVTANTNSGLALTYSVDGPATISGTTISLTGTSGTVNVTVDQAGDINYNAAQSTTLFNVIDNSKQDQTINFDALEAKTFGDTNFDLTATSSSELTISYASSDATIATISGSTVTIVGAGSTIITASQAGDATFNPASDVQQSLVINKADQTISIEAIADKLITDGGFDVTGSTTSGLTLSYAIQSGPATISGTSISLNGTSGEVIVEVTQAGNSNYNVTSETTSFQVNNPSLQDQTITFDPLAPVVYGDPNFSLSATGGASENTITYASSNPNIATVNGNMVTIAGVGTTTITASQAGNENYNAANSIKKNLTVNKADQTIIFSTIAPATYGDANFLLTATGGASGNEITFSSSNPEVAAITGNTVNIIGLGTTTFTASQAGDANYNGASNVEQSLIVNKATQTITFATLDAVTFGDADFDLIATTDASGLAVSYVSSDATIATISGSTVTIVGAGSTIITASQAGDATFNPASEIQQSLVIDKADQTISIEAIADKLITDGGFDVTGSTTSELTLSYAIQSGPATISGTTISLNGTSGEVIVEVTQAGNSNYNTTSASTSFQVTDTSLQDQTITFEALAVKTFGDINFDLTATASSGLPVNFSVVSGSISISGATVSISGAGVATIAVNQVGDDTFNAAEERTRTLTINKATQTITIQPIENQLASTTSFMVDATVDSGQPLAYEVSGPATISDVALTLTGAAGSVIVTVSQVGSDNYLAANASEEFDVIETITGVENLQTTIEFYPNPAKEFLKIEGQNLSKVVIYDLSGQVVLVDQILGNSQVDLGRIKAGHYLLVVNRKDGFSLRRKFVKTN